MIETYVKNLCFDCDDCYTITFIGKPDLLFINDKKNKKYYSWNSNFPNTLEEYILYNNYKEERLIKEDVKLLFSVGIKEFYVLFKQNKLKGIYK